MRRVGMRHAMPADMDRALTTRIEEQLAEAGLQVAVDVSNGGLVLTGIVDSEEAREAASDIVAMAAPGRAIDNQIDVETILPTDIDDFAGDEPTAELAESRSEILAGGGELDPDFTDQPGLNDPIEASGPDSWGPEDPASEGEVYTPPSDPVLTSDAHGRPAVLGGFGSSASDDVTVEPSASDNRPGDEALAEAVRRELADDSATADLQVVVAVRHGVVHLRGRVSDLDDADNAEAVAARVPGVREVVEELDVANV
jgi:osmotically-inducible protein OsmY